MGVYIKGMEMPTRCGRCDMRIPTYLDDGMFDHYECCITAAIIDNLGEKMEDCPLVPVPPHGRLIDADALKLSHCKECTLYPDKCLEKTGEGCDWGSIYHIEHCAPTIIPAELKEEASDGKD